MRGKWRSRIRGPHTPGASSGGGHASPTSSSRPGSVGVPGGAPRSPQPTSSSQSSSTCRSGTAHYRTELTLTNRGSSAVELTLAYRGSLGAAAGMVTEVLPAATQRDDPRRDRLPRRRGGSSFRPLASGTPHAGTLRIAVPEAATSAVSALARTTSPTTAPHPAGASGLAYAAVSPSFSFTGRAVVHGLRATASDRSNLAVFNPGTSPVTVRVVAVSGAGRRPRGRRGRRARARGRGVEADRRGLRESGSLAGVGRRREDRRGGLRRLRGRQRRGDERRLVHRGGARRGRGGASSRSR